MRAPFRITKERSNVISLQAIDEDKSNVDYNFYFDKLVKLIPSEILGLYLTLYSIGIVETEDREPVVDEEWTFWISIISLLLLLVSRIFGTKKSGYFSFSDFGTVQWGSIFISSVSFVIWIYAMGHEFANFEIKQQRIIQASIIIWTFVVPFFYQKRKT